MRLHLINFLKTHPFFVNLAWGLVRLLLHIWGLFVPIRPKTMLFSSFGGRNIDDSPGAIYQEICKRPEFSDWTLIWALVDPDKFKLPRGEKVRIDTPAFFHALLFSRVWVSNSGMDRGIGLRRRGTLYVETWHGSSLKKACGEENQNAIGGKWHARHKGALDGRTIRCAQSELDRDNYQRVFHTTKESILLCGAPRNDSLFHYTDSEIKAIRRRLRIPENKQVILYAPTYREYLFDEHREMYLAPPMDLTKWERLLGDQYVLLIRAHYGVSAALKLKENEFVRDVSKYACLNDLYIITDVLISDYSSTYIDYSILDRPIFCFAYDFEEFSEKRGFYWDLEKKLPCPLDRNEDTLLEHILTMDREKCVQATRGFHQEFAPYAGHASEVIVDEICNRL